MSVLLVAVAATATWVVTRSREKSPVARDLPVAVSYVAKPDGVPGWPAGVRRYLHSGVYLQPVGGGPARAVLPVGLISPIDPLFALLSPDGMQLAVLGQLVDARNHTAGATFAIWITKLDGRGGHTVAAFPEADEVQGPDILDMTWTPDSRKIVFTVDTTSSDLKTEAFRLWQANAEGAPDMTPMPGTAGLDMPAYDRATGTLIAVKTVSTAAERRRVGLVVLRRGARDPVLLPDTVGAIEPVFSPDGSQLAYLIRDDSGADPVAMVIVAKPDGTQSEVVTTGGNIGRLAFGPNGTLYYDESYGIDPSSLFAVPARAHARPTKLRTIGTDVSSPSVALVAEVGTPRGNPAQSSAPPTPRPASSGTLNLHTVDFGNIAAPGASCFAAHPIQLYDGLAYIPNRDGNPDNPITFDPSDKPYYGLRLTPGPVYGRLDAHGHEAAAVALLCDNNGGTAAGQLLFSFAVYSGSSGRLRLVGLITPQVQRPDEHVTILDELAIHVGRITVHERWYGGDDADCCPTGEAISTWTYRDGRLIPHGTRIIATPHRRGSH